MTTAKLNDKGQITIPKKIRDELNLEAGDRFRIRVDGKKLSLRLMNTKIEDVSGMLSEYADRTYSIEEMDLSIAKYLRGKYNKD